MHHCMHVRGAERADGARGEVGLLVDHAAPEAFEVGQRSATREVCSLEPTAVGQRPDLD